MSESLHLLHVISAQTHILLINNAAGAQCTTHTDHSRGLTYTVQHYNVVQMNPSYTLLDSCTCEDCHQHNAFSYLVTANLFLHPSLPINNL